MGTGADEEFGWSEPPVSPDRRAVRRWLWIGCLAVVASLLIFAVSAGILSERYLLRGAREREERMREIQTRLAELEGEIAALDEMYPCRSCAGPSTAVLTEPDLDRYLAVRAALAPRLPALEEAAQEHARKMLSFGPEGDMSIAEMLSMARDPFEALQKVYLACLLLMEAGLDALREQEMGPREFTLLAGAIEFGFLGREDAAWMSLDPEDRESYWSVRSHLAVLQLMVRAEGMKPEWMQGDRLQESRDEIERFRPQVEYMEEKARAGGNLTPGTLGVLDARRAELESLPSEGVRWLGVLDGQTATMVATGLMTEPGSEGDRPAGAP